MHAPGLILASTLLGGAVVIGVSRATGGAYPLLRSRLDRIAPEDRAQVHAALALLPWIAAITILLLAFVPSFVTIPGWIEDHCGPHDHHPHLCLNHGFWMPSGPLWVGVGLLILVGLAVWGRLVLRVIRSHRVVLGLMHVSRTQGAVQVIPDARPLAFSAGLLHPTTVLSEAVLDRLDPQELEVVLDHEAAHAQRRDALWRVIMEAMLLGMGAKSRALLLEDFNLATEEACDRRAIHEGVGADRVAEVLIRMQRLGCHAVEGAPAATGSHLERRVKALLGDPYPQRPRWMKAVWLAPLVLLGADPVHHAAETLLGLFLS